MKTNELIALLDGVEIGRISRDRRGRLSFTYDEGWRHTPDSYPLSLAMPLTAAVHPHARIEAFLWGLLPENPFVLRSWASRFHVSRDAFSLLAHVGLDCPGAVQLASSETVDEMTASPRHGIEWLSEADVADRLRRLRADAAAWRLASDTGQFSLAGAQSKTALYSRGGRWGVPSGRLPTTHILKPPIAGLEGHVENEHLCLRLAREMGLPAAASEIGHFDGEVAIVVERYDRVRRAGSIVRVHQEDTCQALGLLPSSKYESEGGPSAKQIVELLRAFSTAPREDVMTFVAALGFGWITGGTDAHAKNYSLLLTFGPQIRLAPLYDLASILPYPSLFSRKTKLAMKIGGRYLLDQIGRRQWLGLARELRLGSEEVLQRLRTMAIELPDRAVTVARSAARAGLTGSAPGRLADLIAARAIECRRLLDESRRT